MDKKHLSVLRFDQKSSPQKMERNVLVEKKWLVHLEDEGYALTQFTAGADHATFVFTYQDTELTFVLDFVVDTLILDFEGEGLSEDMRIKASRLLERIIESLRFRHKDKYWSLSHYYISDIAQYEARKKADYPAQFHGEWLRIANLAKLENMDDADRLFMQVEGVHDLYLKIVGIDGLALCAYLKEAGLITYEMTGENACVIDFLEPLDELDTINRKIVFAREVAYFGYNIWVDYAE